MRFFLLVLPLALAACANPAPPLSEPEFYAAYDAAVASGDVEGAIAVVKAQAEAGHVGALGQMVAFYRDGYVRGVAASGQRATFYVWPGQEGLWRKRYIRERDRQARAGDDDALFYAAQDLKQPWMHAPRPVPDPTPAELDSAQAILQDLGTRGHATALFFLGADLRKTDSVRSDSLLALAQDAGSFAACVWRVTLVDDGAITTQNLAARIDRGEACRDIAHGRPVDIPSESLVRGLRTGVESGSPEAAAHLDSLRALGVFERYPHLAQI